jgi:hypothetical protein
VAWYADAERWYGVAAPSQEQTRPQPWANRRGNRWESRPAR